MKRFAYVRTLVALGLLLVSAVTFAAYANVNGIRMYYEVHGRGTPVVLLHGGYTDSDIWQVESWLLSYHYKVIEIDSRGHGRSTDGDGPITYELMADDTLALLDQIGVHNAHFVGWSDGAVIGSMIAAFHPERVNQLVLIGDAYRNDVYIPAFSLLMNNDTLFNAFIDGLFKPKYVAVNPNPEHWPVFRDKLHRLWQSPCYFASQPVDYCLEPLQQIAAPTLVIVGDNEIIQASHTQAIVDAIPDARLAVIPLASHFVPITRPFEVSRLILDFLNN